MRLRVLPVHLIGDFWHVFPQPDQQLQVTMQAGATERLVRQMHAEVREGLGVAVEFLPPWISDGQGSAADLAQAAQHADVVLINVSAAFDAAMLAIDKPVIAFSGSNTPMMALYILPPAVRRQMPHVRFALDHAEVEAELRSIAVARAVARLRQARMLVLGEYRCFEQLPEPQRLRERLGVELKQLDSSDFLLLGEGADPHRVAQVAQQWREQAQAVEEPDEEDLMSAARLFVALHDHMLENGYSAASVGCLEVMYQHAVRPFCFVLATLRDMGLPAGCESDATATLTMLVLEFLAERPAYMGNLVLTDPATNLVAVSHGCSPRFMHGRDAEALPYRLVHSHSVPPFSRDASGGAGLTSYVDYGQAGQAVTLCRLAADLDECFVAGGEIVECRDTICDRTTLTVRVADARAYAHRATGNHQVLIYGDYRAELREFCRLTGMRYADGAEPLLAHG